MSERYCPNCGDKLDDFTAQHEHDTVCRFRYAVERGKLVMEQSDNRLRSRITEAERVFNELIDKEIAHYAGKLVKKAFRDAMKTIGTDDHSA